MYRYTSILVLLLVFLSGCGTSEKIAKSTALVEEFHTLFNARSYVSLYKKLLHPDWRANQNQTEFNDTMEKIRGMTGFLQGGKRTGFNWKTTLGTGTTVVVTYDSQFSNGRIRETFTFKYSDKTLKLMGYRVDPLEKLRTPEAESV